MSPRPQPIKIRATSSEGRTISLVEGQKLNLDPSTIQNIRFSISSEEAVPKSIWADLTVEGAKDICLSYRGDLEGEAVDGIHYFFNGKYTKETGDFRIDKLFSDRGMSLVPKSVDHYAVLVLTFKVSECGSVSAPLPTNETSDQIRALRAQKLELENEVAALNKQLNATPSSSHAEDTSYTQQIESLNAALSEQYQSLELAREKIAILEEQNSVLQKNTQDFDELKATLDTEVVPLADYEALKQQQNGVNAALAEQFLALEASRSQVLELTEKTRSLDENLEISNNQLTEAKTQIASLSQSLANQQIKTESSFIPLEQHEAEILQHTSQASELSQKIDALNNAI
ncbi:MAG: hypothetical protein ACWA40_06500 [Planktomarina sp.]